MKKEKILTKSPIEEKLFVQYTLHNFCSKKMDMVTNNEIVYFDFVNIYSLYKIVFFF